MNQTVKINSDYLRFLKDARIASLYSQIHAIYNKSTPTLSEDKNGLILTFYDEKTEYEINCIINAICDIIENEYPNLFEKK